MIPSSHRNSYDTSGGALSNNPSSHSLTHASPIQSTPRLVGQSTPQSAGLKGPLLPPMTMLPSTTPDTASATAPSYSQQQLNSGRRTAPPMKLDGLASGTTPILPPVNPVQPPSSAQANGPQLEPLSYMPRPSTFDSSLSSSSSHPYGGYVQPFPPGPVPGIYPPGHPATTFAFDPFTSPLPLTLSSVVDPASSDPFSSQLANRRYNLMIRAAPATTGQSHRPTRSKKPHQQSLDADALVQLGQAQARRPHFLATDAATARNQARLNKMFGEKSSYAKRQRRLKAKEEQEKALQAAAAAAGSQSTRRGEKHPHPHSPKKQNEEKQAHDLVVQAQLQSHQQQTAPTTTQTNETAATAAAQSNAANKNDSLHSKQKKKIFNFLTQLPLKHHFFDHLPKQPVISEKHVERIYEEVGGGALQHLRILESNHSQFDSVQELLNAIVQSELTEREVKESERNREASATKFNEDGTTSANSGQLAQDAGYQTEHERLLSTITQQDRDRLIAYLTSTPYQFEDGTTQQDTITVRHPDGTITTQVVPSECHLFGDSEFVTATPRELNELILEGGKDINSCLAQLIQLDQVSGRQFDNFTQLLFAMHVAELDAEVSKKSKLELTEYFKRGEELWKKEAQRKKNKEAAAAKKLTGGVIASKSSYETNYDDETGISTTKLKRHTAGSGPLSCHLFLNSPHFIAPTPQDIDRLYDESCAGRDTMLHLRTLESSHPPVRLQTFQELIDLVLNVHLKYLRKNKLYMINFTPVTRADRNEVLKYLNSPDVHFFIHPSNQKRLEEGKQNDRAPMKEIQATSDEVAILISESQSLPITLGYLRDFMLRDLKFAAMEDCIFEVKSRHARFKKELLRFFRSELCQLFAMKEESEEERDLFIQEEKDNKSDANIYEDPNSFTMSLMDRLIIESRFQSTQSLFQVLLQLNEDGWMFQTFHGLIEFLQNLSEKSAKYASEEKQTLLQFLSSTSSACHLLPRELQLFETDIQRLWQASGEDTLVLTYYLNDQKRSFSSVEDLIGALKDEAQAVASQKLEIFKHLLSKHSRIFEKLAWDPSVLSQALNGMTNTVEKDTLRHNYYHQLLDQIPRQRRRIGGSGSQTQSSISSPSNKMSFPQLVVEAAANETRLRLQVLSGQQLDSQGHIIPSSTPASSRKNGDPYAFGSDLIQGSSLWTNPTMLLPTSPSTDSAIATSGIVKLSPNDISRLYRHSGAGPLTLTYLWQLEVQHTHFQTIDDLLNTIRGMHEEYRLKSQVERHLLIQDLLQSQNSVLFTHPLKVTEEEIERLLKIFHEVTPTLFHLHHLRSIERSYSSFQELESEMKDEKYAAESVQRELLQYLRHPLCYLLPTSGSGSDHANPSGGEITLNLDTIKRLFYESTIGFDLPFYLQVLDGRSGGRIDLEEQRRRMRQYEMRKEQVGLGVSAAATSATNEDESTVLIEDRQSKFTSLTELILALKTLKQQMNETEVKCAQFLNTGRATLFYQENDYDSHQAAAEKTLALRRAQGQALLKAAGEEKEQQSSTTSLGVYTIGGPRSPESKAIAVQSPISPSTPAFQAANANGNTNPSAKQKSWTHYEVSRLMIEGEAGVDTLTHLIALQQEHLAFRTKLQAAQYAAKKAAQDSGRSPDQVDAISSEEAVMQQLGLTPPPVYHTIEELLQRLQAMQRELVLRRNQDKSILYAFVSQSYQANALMSLQFHTMNHSSRRAGLLAGAGNGSTALALITNGHQASNTTSDLKLTQTISSLPGFDPLLADEELSSEDAALSSVRCIWHAEEIDLLYEVGQSSSVGPATLLYLIELEQQNKQTGRKFHSVQELVDALRQIKVTIVKRKQDILDYLLEYAPRFFAVNKKKASASTSTAMVKSSKKSTPAANKVVKGTDQRIGLRAGRGAPSGAVAVAAAASSSAEPTFFIPTYEDISQLYEHAGAGVWTLEVLKYLELEVVGRQPFTGLDDLIASVNQEYVRRSSLERQREKELIGFLTNPLGCPLFETLDQRFSRASVQFLIGCTPNASASTTVFFIQTLLEQSQASGKKFATVFELFQTIKEKSAEEEKECEKILAFLSTGQGRLLLYGSPNFTSSLGTLTIESIRRLYVESGLGRKSLEFLQKLVLNQKTFASSDSSVLESPFTLLIQELSRQHLSEQDEFKFLKQRVFAYLRREKGSEVEGVACDLWQEEGVITSSLQHIKAIAPASQALTKRNDSTALVVASEMTDSATAAATGASGATSTISGTITYNDVNHLFHTAQSGKYTLDYLHQFNMDLKSFKSLEELCQALRTYHEHMTQLKTNIWKFFTNNQGGAAFDESASISGSYHLFEASPYEITINSDIIDTLIREGECGEETLSYLYRFSSLSQTFQTLDDLIGELRQLKAQRLTSSQEDKLRILEFISNPSCQLFRHPIQITDYHLELLVEAGRKSMISSNEANSTRLTPASTTLQVLTYLNTSLHWFTTPKALVLGVRQVLAEILETKRKLFKWINNLHIRGGGSSLTNPTGVGKRRLIVGEEEECTIWDRSLDLAPEQLEEKKLTAASGLSGGRAGKTQKRAVSIAPQQPLKLTTDELNDLFEQAGSGPETFDHVRRMCAAHLKFSQVSDFISATKQFHLLQLKYRRELLSFLQQPTCTIFSKCPPGYVFFLTLGDCRMILERLENEQLQEEEEWLEEQKRGKYFIGNKGGSGSSPSNNAESTNGAYPSYASTLLPEELQTVNDLVHYPYETRVLRLLKELSEIKKKVLSFQELLHVLIQSSYELQQREDGILAFLNDTKSCRFFTEYLVKMNLPPGQKPWNRFHVRRLLQEVALYNSNEEPTTEDAQTEYKEESKYQNDIKEASVAPARSSRVRSSEEVYIGLGDCLLLLWNLNASGRVFHSFSELVQALKTEYLLASEFILAQQQGGGKASLSLGGDEVAGIGSTGSSKVSSLVAPKLPSGAAATGGSNGQELLITTPTYLDTLALHTMTYAAQPRHAFSWESYELEYLFHMSYLSPGLLTAALKVKYLEWINGKQSLLHFFKRKNNPIFTVPVGREAIETLQQSLNFLQTESGVNTLWYGSGCREYCLSYLSSLISSGRSFESLAELMKNLKAIHRKRLLQTKFQAIVQQYDETASASASTATAGSSSIANEFITDDQRKQVLDFLMSDLSTIFRSVTSTGSNPPGAIPGQTPLPIEKDPYALPVLADSGATKPVSTGVSVSKSDLDTMITVSGGSVNLVLLSLRYLSKFSRSFTNVAELIPILKQLHQEHLDQCKLLLKFFYQSDCLLLNYQGDKSSQDASSNGGLLLLQSASSTSLGTLSNSSSMTDLPTSMSRQELDDQEMAQLDLSGLNGGGSNSGRDLNLSDMSYLIREGTGGLPVLPHLQNFDAARLRFKSFQQLVSTVKDTQCKMEQEQSVQAHSQKYQDACYEFLSSPWTGLFTDTIHSPPVLPSSQEFAGMLQVCSGSSTALLVNLHAFNNAGRKFRNYQELLDALVVAQSEAGERKEEIWHWLRSSENKLFSHAANLKDEKHVSGDRQSQLIQPGDRNSSSEDKPIEWTWDHVNRLYEETDAAADTLSHLYTLNTLGAKFYKFSSLLDAVTEQHTKLKQSRAEATLAARKKEGKALIRSYLLDPSTHLFAVPVQINDHHITQLYEIGEQGETTVGIRLLGKRTRPGASTVHCLQALEMMRPGTTDKFANFQDLIIALQGAAINLIIERAESIGVGEVAHKPPEVLATSGVGNALASSEPGAASNAAALTVANVSGMAPFLLSAADKQLILEYLSSPSCTLFAQLASSPIRQTLAVKTSDLQEMTRAAGGDGANVIMLLKRLDQQGRQFESFQELVYAVKVEALTRPPPATLTPDQTVKLLAYLSKSFLLYDRVDLSHKVSKADLLKLLELSGKSLENVICNLQDVSENHTQLIPSTTWAQFLEKVEANWNALARLKREVLAYLLSVERDLFSAATAAPPSFSPNSPESQPTPPNLGLTLQAMDTFFIQTGSGIHTLTYLMSFSRAHQSFRSLQELSIAVRSSHLATQNIRQSEVEGEKQKILTYLGESQHIKQLFIPQAATASTPKSSSSGIPPAPTPSIAPSIAISDSGLREMLKLSGTAQACIQLLNVLYDKGVRVASFEELLNKFKQQVIQTYA